ncbi:hexose transporter [Beauveria bassiana ARSEF 2860]|uniref:Hexose transporter n=1 Tax=Beauveria bassiana (strain ARSEF 2860) TaxID=655819 RepID=J4URI1_BEAB2|nr:hexose transporter [Beauveria bassiana ARSEF 2860]EJP68117.1 hexose transporter [Beauveria bassiana ARSEF 2860]
MEGKQPESEHSEHTDAVRDDGVEPYGPGGIRGVIQSPYVVACASLSAIGGILFGYDQGVISVILVMDQFLDRFGEVSDTAPGSGFYKGLMTAMITLGAFIGAMNQGWLADAYSRKYSIMIAVAIFTVGSVLQTAAIDYPMLVAARLIGGIGIGMLSMVVPLYISEISPPEIRGTLLVLEELSIVVGIVVSFWITYGTQYIHSHWSWQLPFLLQIVPGLILGFAAIFLPFSPRWLASQGREQEALVELAKLRRLPATDARVQKEWSDIITDAKFQAAIVKQRHPSLTGGGTISRVRLEFAGWVDCVRPGCWRRTLVGAGLMFFQQANLAEFVGINALIYYAPTLFGTMGLDLNMSLIMSGVVNVAQLVGVVSSLWTMDRFGRRKLLLTGSVAMCISHIIITALVGMYSGNWPQHTTAGWTSVAFLFVYMLAFGASWGPVPWAMPAEIFPSSLRAKGVAISTCSNWINNFIIGLVTPPLVQNTGWGAYLFFAFFCLFSGLWTFYFVPETNGKTLEQMDDVFNDCTGAEEMAQRANLREQMASQSTAS